MCAGAKCGGNSTHLPKDFNMGRARDRIGVVSDQVDRGNERPQRHQVNAFTSRRWAAYPDTAQRRVRCPLACLTAESFWRS
jgi:hypothetical protein